jgi:SAM-dependent methyltransferase
MITHGNSLNIKTALISASKSLISARDKDFLRRVFSQDISFYVQKLKGLKFFGFDRVLDAGSGFGQWSIALSGLNNHVVGVEINYRRLFTAQQILRAIRDCSIDFLQSSVEILPFSNNSFDAIFCFSVVYDTNYPKVFKEFYRILKPGGKLYICANGFGWYLFRLVNNYNPSKDFNPRVDALETFIHSLGYYLMNYHIQDKSLVMSPRGTTYALQQAGFDKVNILSNDKSLNLQGAEPISIYPRTYFGMTNVFEVLAFRENDRSSSGVVPM